MRQKIAELEKIYAGFDAATSVYRRGAACAKGCAFCCTDAGSVDITTLEGLVIRDHIGRLPRSRRKSVQKAVMREMQAREAGLTAACPFLMQSKACRIYPIRPLACRRIYSLHPCSRDNPPVLSRRVMQYAREAITALQRLDEVGYTGHISFILYMLDAPRFLEVYLAGGFKPEEIAAFGKTHKITINKTAVQDVSADAESVIRPPFPE